jgi:DMSO/TMAO reductase YedYZ molybdopterin-dependent catalytic subunit
MNPEPISRRAAVKLGLAGLAAAGAGEALAHHATGAEPATSGVSDPPRPFLTPADQFRDVSRGNPRPYSLRGDALIQARLTPETWRLEVVGDESAQVGTPMTLADGTALDLPFLHELGQKHGVKFLKAMQCLNIDTPLGQGLWEGVPLRFVLRRLGTLANVRRVYYWGFHNNDPKQLFQSSLSYTQAMETPPGEMPPFLAYKLNGEPIPLKRGGPVRMVIPWAHGFKSIKWLRKIVLTNDFKANDTYANANNDPESHLKTAAYLDELEPRFAANRPVRIHGLAIAGMSGLARVEFWLRRVDGPPVELAADDPAWGRAEWVEGRLSEPPADWRGVLPEGVSAGEVLGFDRRTGRPATWPLRYSMVSWSATLDPPAPGSYEVRARSVDLNGDAQPEPRPYLKSGKNPIQVRRFEVA